MESCFILDKIEFAIEYNKSVEIVSKKGKISNIEISSFDGTYIEGYFVSKYKKDKMQYPMNINNIKELSFNYLDNKDFINTSDVKTAVLRIINL